MNSFWKNLSKTLKGWARAADRVASKLVKAIEWLWTPKDRVYATRKRKVEKLDGGLKTSEEQCRKEHGK